MPHSNSCMRSLVLQGSRVFIRLPSLPVRITADQEISPDRSTVSYIRTTVAMRQFRARVAVVQPCPARILRPHWTKYRLNIKLFFLITHMEDVDQLSTISPTPPGEATPGRPAARLLPSLRPLTKDFWTGGEHGELRVHRCRACGRFFHPPAPICVRCQSFDVAPEAVSGRGTIAAFTVNHQPWLPKFPPPYVVALVEIEEEPGVRLPSNIIGCPHSEVEIGMRVEVVFEQWEDVWLPLFRPEAAR